MLTVPLQATPNQTVAVPLAGQSCQLNVYQKSTSLMADVLVDGEIVLSGVLCLDRNRLIRDLYLGFVGDLAFFDTQGLDDPAYTGLGGRYQLVYIEASELPAGVG